MNCWHCKTELIWGGDEDYDDSMITNLSCPTCNSLVLVYYPKEIENEENDIYRRRRRHLKELRLMNCWHCKTELSWDSDEDYDDSMITNLSCPTCNSLVLVYYPKEIENEKNDI